MLYLYTLLMRAWDLDADTHQYFRIYLTHFIYLRKVSKDIRKIAEQLNAVVEEAFTATYGGTSSYR